MSEEGISLVQVDDLTTEPVKDIDKRSTFLYCVQYGFWLPAFLGLFCLALDSALIVWLYRYIVPPSDQLARHHELDFLAKEAGLSKLAPYWLDYIQKVCKIVGIIIIFGPDKPGKVEDSEDWCVKAKKLGVSCVACFSIAMMIFTLILDIRDMMHAWHAVDSGVQKTFAMMVIFATSPNQVACWSIYGIMRLYAESDPSTPKDGQGEEKMRQEKGLVTLIYFYLSMPLMGISSLLLFFAAPAFIAYLLFLLPILVALAIQADLIMNFAAWRRSPATPDNSCSVDEWLMAHFGSSQQGLFEYVYCATFWPWLVCFCVPLACRLYSGHGYWESLAHTLTDRYLQDYWIAIRTGMERKVLLFWEFFP